MRRSIHKSIHYSAVIMVVMHMMGCSERTTLSRPAHDKEFVSEVYNHFEGGVLFTDIDLGLTVLWLASFKHGHMYKENLGFFVDGGLLISPNKYNSRRRSSFNALYTFPKDGKLFVEYNGSDLQVLGIIHTHPDKGGIQTPTPGSDYQFGYLGIHNYVITKNDLFVAYKDSNGDELYERLGGRNSYSSIPIINVKANDILIASN